MRHFRFTLRLRDGRTFTADALAETWRWSSAFSHACQSVERRLGLDPWSGIVCVAYDSGPAGPLTMLTERPADVALLAAA